MKEPMKVTCIGAGNVGRAWAIKFAMGQCKTVLYDVSAEKLDLALRRIDESLSDIEAMGIGNSTELQSRISVTTSLQEAVRDASYIQESVPENTSLKTAVFHELDSLADDTTIIGSSTSEIPASDFCAELKGRQRCLVAHPLNPPYLIPLVELCPSPWTSETALTGALTFFRSIGQRPIVVQKEVSGFVANRMQLAVLAEAVSLISAGVCSPEDVDTAMRDGLAMRWLFMGPFETGHLNYSTGFSDYVSAYKDCHSKIVADLNIDYDTWTKETIESIDSSLSASTPHDQISQRQAWRDRKLMQLNRFLDGVAK